MKNSKQLLPILAVLTILVIGLIFFQIYVANASIGISDTLENQEIMKAMDKGYEVIAYASQTNDPSRFSEIFVDTADYKPSKEVKDAVEKAFGSTVAENAGYLTAMQVKYINRGKASEKMKAAVEKAQSENRKLTKKELDEIIKENNGQLPPSGTYKSSKGKTKLTFKKIEVNGDRAVVDYDDGAAYQKATLVRINNQWFISNIEAIQVHF